MAEDRVTLRHGAGGRAMRALIEEVLAAPFVDLRVDGVGLAAMDDGAALRVGDRWLVLTTDSHVVHPIFFPGGDIGRLAVAGTVNDLAMMGATEVLGLTCAMVIEEGFLVGDLERVQASMRVACAEAQATIVTGDTKVMGRGEVDGLVVTTTGYSPSERDGFNEVRRKGVVIAQVFPSGEHVPQGSQGQGEGPRPAGTTSQPPLPPSVAVQHLTPQKARILLMLALTKTRDPREVQRFFDEY